MTRQPIPTPAEPKALQLARAAMIREGLARGLALPPRGLLSRPFADARRPAPIAGPPRRDVAALAKPGAFERWNAGIRAATTAGDNTITIYDVIGYDWWTDGGVTVNRIDAALRKIGADNAVEVHINSPGGDMFEGIAIYNRLLEHRGKVTVKVMGLAASAASVIAMAGDEILIGPASFFMIHNAWVLVAGDRNVMAETSAWLAPFDAAMAAVYADKSGRTAAEVAGWMDAETWMNGTQAVERGFATALLSSSDIVEDTAATARARETNAVRQAEINLCRAGSTREEARALLNKIRGDAAPDTPSHRGGPIDLGLAAQLTAAFRA